MKKKIKIILFIFNIIIAICSCFFIPFFVRRISITKTNMEEQEKQYYFKNYDKELDCRYLGEFEQDGNKYILFKKYYNEGLDVYIGFRYLLEDNIVVNNATYTTIYYNEENYEVKNIEDYENVKVYDKTAFGNSFKGYTNGRIDFEVIVLTLVNIVVFVPLTFILFTINLFLMILDFITNLKNKKNKI